MEANKNESVALFFTNGSSDKEYHVHLKAADGEGLYRVDFLYGRRGSSLKSGTKTKEPLEYAAAKKLYDKVVAGQLKEGYTKEESGAVYQTPVDGKVFTGIVPQLLNIVDEESFGSQLEDDGWMLQEKFDGQRLMLRLADVTVQAINRDGILVAGPQSFEMEMLRLACRQAVLDGEWLGERYAAFDLLELDGVDLRPLPAQERKAKLDVLLGRLDPESPFFSVETVFGTEAKKRLHDKVKADGGEGVVAKRVDSPYEAGRPNSGGSQLKRKFVESATCRVRAASATKRSVSLELMDDSGSWIDVGNVTIPANHEIPSSGKLVEIQYLYAYPGGSLYQPVYKGERVDLSESACVSSQLKFKKEGAGASEVKKTKLRK